MASDSKYRTITSILRAYDLSIGIMRRGLHLFDCIEFEPAEELSKVVVLEMRRYQLVAEE